MMNSISLNQQEEIVLTHLLHGLTAKEIGAGLSKSKRTIDRYSLRLNQVFDTKTRIGLIVQAIQYPKWYATLISTGNMKELALKPFLGARQIEVLNFLLAGRTNKEIAKLMFIDLRSVENTRRRIVDKWDLSNTAELVKISIATGYLKMNFEIETDE